MLRDHAVLEFVFTTGQVLEQTGGSVTSWLRSADRNRTVGGVAQSLHLVGLALDAVFDTRAGKRRAVELLQALSYGVLDEGDHLHIQARPLRRAKKPAAPGVTPPAPAEPS